MKKLTAILVSLTLTLCLAGCSDSSSDAEKSSSKADSSSVSAVDNSSASDSENPTDGDEPIDSEEPSGTPDNGEISFSGMTVVDNDECSIKLTGFEKDDIFGMVLKAELVNKSSDKKYMFSVSSCSVNNLAYDPFFGSEVEAGKTDNCDITFMGDEIDILGYENLTDIEISFRVYDNDDWAADDIVNETVHIYPYGEDKATVYKREPQATDKVLVDNEYAKITVTGAAEDSFFGYEVGLYIENKSDKNLSVSLDDVYVNDIECDPLYATSVDAGKSAYSSISWFNSVFEENKIEVVEKIEGQLRISDSDDWLLDSYFTDKVVIQP